ncbi:MAG: alpha/beta hydrolase [Burkholderiales bacterium]|nr:alpha/beta hydrolase [Burkholderiales bacterium]
MLRCKEWSHPRAWAKGWPTALLHVVGLMMMVLSAGPVQAAEPDADWAASPCGAVLLRADDGRPARPPVRLPGLTYTCVPLADGQTLAVGRVGPAHALADTPVVLLVHGLGQNAHTDWAATALDLARDHQVLAVDLPGFGASPPSRRALAFAALADQLAELITRLAPGRRVQVVGHSLGGALSLALAHRHPGLVDRLVMVDAAGILLKPVFMQHIVAQKAPATGFALDGLIGTVVGKLHGLSSLLFLGRDDRYDFTPWLMRNPDVRRALLGGMVQLDSALGLVEHDFSAAIRATTAPTTLIWGDADRIAPLRTGQLLAARLPRARLQVLPGAGHTPMADQPGEFALLLREALVGPLPAPRASADAAALVLAPSQGHGLCQGTDGARYTGRYDSLTLRRCGRVHIHAAHIGRLVLDNSTVSISDSVIDASDATVATGVPADAVGVAIDARDSELSATAVQLRGRIGIRSSNSWFDLAGVSLRATGPGITLPADRTRIFWSVSDWQASDYNGDAHFIWPRTGAPQ